jgi:hypothetical protein
MFKGLSSGQYGDLLIQMMLGWFMKRFFIRGLYLGEICPTPGMEYQ